MRETFDWRHVNKNYSNLFHLSLFSWSLSIERFLWCSWALLHLCLIPFHKSKREEDEEEEKNEINQSNLWLKISEWNPFWEISGNFVFHSFEMSRKVFLAAAALRIMFISKNKFLPHSSSVHGSSRSNLLQQISIFHFSYRKLTITIKMLSFLKSFCAWNLKAAAKKK